MSVNVQDRVDMVGASQIIENHVQIFKNKRIFVSIEGVFGRPKLVRTLTVRTFFTYRLL
jgi:hypothetical protein